MYSMNKPPKIKTHISFITNTTEKDLTITIDNQKYTIKSGEERKLNQEIATIIKKHEPNSITNNNNYKKFIYENKHKGFAVSNVKCITNI